MIIMQSDLPRTAGSMIQVESSQLINQCRGRIEQIEFARELKDDRSVFQWAEKRNRWRHPCRWLGGISLEQARVEMDRIKEDPSGCAFSTVIELMNYPSEHRADDMKTANSLIKMAEASATVWLTRQDWDAVYA